jgi:hypothetical protein
MKSLAEYLKTRDVLRSNARRAVRKAARKQLRAGHVMSEGELTKLFRSLLRIMSR